MPKNSIIVVCGVSGSGKSSLAFDTIFAEGQRRYIESLSSYARQFLGQIDKPDVDSISGLSPSVAIDQKSGSHNPRSTVGTVTEVWDYLRLLYARIGVPICLKCSGALSKQSVDEIVNNIYDNYTGKNILVCAPIIEGKKGAFKEAISELSKQGFGRVRVNGSILKIEEYLKIENGNKKVVKIDLVVDRLSPMLENKDRVHGAVETALKMGNSYVTIVNGESELSLSSELSCPRCKISRQSPEPRNFSFNSPYGSCVECEGLGVHQEPDERIIVRDTSMSLREGAVTPWSESSSYKYYLTLLKAVCDKYGGDLDTEYKKLPKICQNVIINGDPELKIKSTFKSSFTVREYSSSYEGVAPFLIRKSLESTESTKDRYKIYFREKLCKTCKGSRLNKEALSVFIGGLNIAMLSSLNLDQLNLFLNELKITKKEEIIAEKLLLEIKKRINFLTTVGLNYLSLDRKASTLSGGESQRIRLATQIGTGLTGVLYVLDEPSIGLHQRDNMKLLETIRYLKELGNTVIIVEHDEETILFSDYVVEIGPDAGSQGGNLVFEGEINDFLLCDSLTSRYVTGAVKVSEISERKLEKNYLTIVGAVGNNLKNISCDFLIGGINVVTGVSGSGKSTLINDTLAPGLTQILNKGYSKGMQYKKIVGAEKLDKIVVIDQSPIGRTPRSNPATYVGIFDTIRTLFSKTEEAKIRGYDQGRFSFNVPLRNGGGRCESCQGEGTLRISMNFLPDVYVECEVCKGRRFNTETLEIKYNGNSISDVLAMTVKEALLVFKNNITLERQLKVLMEVGLGYMKLGQSATTLSGGEAQRIKLASELSKRSTGRTIYILDEPTTGLHFEDVKNLLNVLNKLVEKGNTVIIIEHNLDVVLSSDRIIDLGPEAGPNGGEVIYQGPLQGLLNCKSETGKFAMAHHKRINL